MRLLAGVQVLLAACLAWLAAPLLPAGSLSLSRCLGHDLLEAHLLVRKALQLCAPQPASNTFPGCPVAASAWPAARRYMADSGEMVRPWCPATRLLDQREMDALNARAETAKRAGMTDTRFSDQAKPLREGFPPLEVGPACASLRHMQAAGMGALLAPCGRWPAHHTWRLTARAAAGAYFWPRAGGQGAAAVQRGRLGLCAAGGGRPGCRGAGRGRGQVPGHLPHPGGRAAAPRAPAHQGGGRQPALQCWVVQGRQPGQGSGDFMCPAWLLCCLPTTTKHTGACQACC